MKTKRITSIICMLCLFVSSMLATTFEYKGIKYEVVSSTDQTATVAAGNSVTGDITIPKLVMDASTATAYRVISISANAFKDCTELTSVTFKAELTSIGASAFANTGLISITIPEAITVINESTFSGCASLTSVTLSSATTSIGNSAFANSGLTSITIPDGVTSIGESAFANSGLTSITIPEGVTTINESTFSGCASLASVTLSSATTSIGKSAFANSGLNTIVIPDGVKVINESAFSGCTSLSTITLPSHLSSIGATAFYQAGLTSLDLGIAIHTIGKSAFEGCSNLKSVNCTYRAMTIGENAFKDCVALENLSLDTIPYDYVDLGLPSGTKWATCNVGADSPEDYGDYFAWGETTGYDAGKTTFSWSTYKYCYGLYDTQTKYCTNSSYGTVDNKTELDTSDDAAYVNWGSDWRMPSLDQIKELYNSSYTTTTWTTENGVYGRKITSKTNGNSIFLPAAGCRDDSSLISAGSSGDYWSRSLVASDSSSAYSLYFYSSFIVWCTYYRYCGQSVRPVRASE